MKRSEAEAVFLEKDVLPLHRMYLSRMKEELIKEPGRMEAVLGACLQKARTIVEKEGFETGFLVFTLLRTELLEHRGRFLIMAYDDKWFFGECRELFWMDVSRLYGYFFQFWEEAKQKAVRFMGKVSDFAVEKMVLDLVLDYHEEIAAFLNTKDSWQSFYTQPEIYLGEYMGGLKRLGKEG